MTWDLTFFFNLLVEKHPDSTEGAPLRLIWSDGIFSLFTFTEPAAALGPHVYESATIVVDGSACRDVGIKSTLVSMVTLLIWCSGLSKADSLHSSLYYSNSFPYYPIVIIEVCHIMNTAPTLDFQTKLHWKSSQNDSFFSYPSHLWFQFLRALILPIFNPPSD